MQFFVKGFVRSEYFPIAAIAELRKAGEDYSGKAYSAKVYLQDGREITVDDEDIDRIVRQSTPVVPALPGFSLLTFSYQPGDDEPGPWVHREPIIGWRDNPYGGLDPVVIDYDFTEMEHRHAILEPGGRIQASDRGYVHEANWIADMKEMADAEHARKLADAEQGNE